MLEGRFCQFWQVISISAGFKASFFHFCQKTSKMTTPRGYPMGGIRTSGNMGISRMSQDQGCVHFSLLMGIAVFDLFEKKPNSLTGLTVLNYSGDLLRKDFKVLQHLTQRKGNLDIPSQCIRGIHSGYASLRKCRSLLLLYA